MLAQFRTLWTLRHFTVVSNRIICNTMSSFSKRCDYIYIAFPDIPVYLTRVDLKEIETESSSSNSKISRYFNVDNCCYFVFSEYPNDTEFQNCYIQSAIKSQTVYRKSAEWSYWKFAHCVNKSSQQSNNFYKRGVCIFDSALAKEKAGIPDKLRDLAKQESAFVPYELRRYNKSPNVLMLRGLGDDEDTFFSVSPCPADAASNLSPLFAIPDLSPVFHSYEEARKVLKQIQYVPEVKELLEISSRNVSMEILAAQKGDLPHPFVVVEGMDATGKTTLTEELENRMGAVRYYTPPKQITHLRAHFDRYPEIVRRAYYCMGNYIVAMEIIEECQSRPVIMDRFWHSTTAYGIANETSSCDLPEPGHAVYAWPADLVKPTLVLFLTVLEEVRKERLSGRGLQATFEEKSLDKDWLFRQRLCESYKRMANPACVEIDAGGTVEEVRNTAIKILHAHGVNFSRP